MRERTLDVAATPATIVRAARSWRSVSPGPRGRRPWTSGRRPVPWSPSTSRPRPPQTLRRHRSEHARACLDAARRDARKLVIASWSAAPPPRSSGPRSCSSAWRSRSSASPSHPHAPGQQRPPSRSAFAATPPDLSPASRAASGSGPQDSTSRPNLASSLRPRAPLGGLPASRLGADRTSRPGPSCGPARGSLPRYRQWARCEGEPRERSPVLLATHLLHHLRASDPQLSRDAGPLVAIQYTPMLVADDRHDHAVELDRGPQRALGRRIQRRHHLKRLGLPALRRLHPFGPVALLGTPCSLCSPSTLARLAPSTSGSPSPTDCSAGATR